MGSWMKLLMGVLVLSNVSLDSLLTTYADVFTVLLKLIECGVDFQ